MKYKITKYAARKSQIVKTKSQIVKTRKKYCQYFTLGGIFRSKKKILLLFSVLFSTYFNILLVQTIDLSNDQSPLSFPSDHEATDATGYRTLFHSRIQISSKLRKKPFLSLDENSQSCVAQFNRKTEFSALKSKIELKLSVARA